MEYRVITNFCYKGKGYQKGDRIECPGADAQLLIGMGRIKESEFVDPSPEPAKPKMKKKEMRKNDN